MKTHILFSLLICGHLLMVRAQNEGAKWYFGYGAGLDFMTNPPTVLTNGMLSTMEGCSTISDEQGNLLFYTNGISIWNKFHVLMANGGGLLGNTSTSQSALIVRQPGSNSLYYVFTMGTHSSGAGPLAYSIVDLSLAAGAGSVTVKNMTLALNSTEKLIAVRHANGADAWIITHELGNSNFNSYLLSSSGLNPNPVVCTTGSSYISGHTGTLKASPNGQKLGSCFRHEVELYSFDNSTGIVSNPLALGSFTYAYGCEFSPDGSKFYASSWLENSNPVYQWDLNAGNPSAIVASKTLIGSVTGVQWVGSFHLAPNGKIYISRYFQNYLSEITNPNASGTACNLVNQGLSIAPGNCGYGFQNLIHSSSSIITKINENVAAADIPVRLFPNPVRDALTIESEIAAQLSIFDVQGKNVLDYRAVPGRQVVNVSELKNGSFVVKVRSEKGQKTMRLLKSN